MKVKGDKGRKKKAKSQTLFLCWFLIISDSVIKMNYEEM